MFEKLEAGNTLAISEEEAARLMVGACRSVPESIASLKANPWGQLKTNIEGALIRWRPEV